MKSTLKSTPRLHQITQCNLTKMYMRSSDISLMPSLSTPLKTSKIKTISQIWRTKKRKNRQLTNHPLSTNEKEKTLTKAQVPLLLTLSLLLIMKMTRKCSQSQKSTKTPSLSPKLNCHRFLRRTLTLTRFRKTRKVL